MLQEDMFASCVLVFVYYVENFTGDENLACLGKDFLTSRIIIINYFFMC